MGGDQARLDRAVGRARFAGAGIALLVGPLTPNLGMPFVVSLAVLLVAYGTLVRVRAERARTEDEARAIAWLAFAADAGIVAYAMLVFAPDPLWTTFVLGTLVILIGAFRFGRPGAVAGTLSMSVAYLAVSAVRDLALGFPFAPAPASFHVSYFLLTAVLSEGILRELHGLRREREDVVRRETAAAEASHAAERSHRVLGSALDAVVGMDANGTITEWNPQAEALFGWPSDEAIGRELAATIVPERSREAHRRGLVTAVETGEGPVLGRRIEIDGLHRDGTEVPVELSIVRVEVAGGVSFTGFVRDLTERRRAESVARREIAREQADRAQRALLMNASHELRTPLNAILGFTELLEDGLRGALTDRQERYLRNIREAGGRLLGLVEDLLELTRLQSGGGLQVDRIAIGELIAPVAEEGGRRAADRGLSLAVSHPDDLVVRLDPARMRQVLMTLLMTAIRSAPVPGGLELRAAVDGSELALEVVGGAAQLATEGGDRLFDALEPPGDEVADGGVGLAVARRLVEMHGGTVDVHLADEASTLRVRLPQAVEEAGASAAY